MNKKYRIVAYIRVECDKSEEELFDSYEDAQKEADGFIEDTETIYKIEEVDLNER